MTTMITELYDALKDAGADEQKARKAAEAVAAYDQRFATLETRIVELAGRVGLVQWMLGTNIILTLGVLWKVVKL